MNLYRTIFLFSLIIISACVSPNEDEMTKQQSFNIRVAFYNVENLFDTIDDPNTKDEEFLPVSPKKWTIERYQKKLDNLAEVVAAMGYPELLGLAEIENRRVLEDLINHEKLKEAGYNIVHDDSPDFRGIDVALLYRTAYFDPFFTRSIPIEFEKEDYQTREILSVSGLLRENKETKADTLHLLVNHWPSRSGGLAKSEPRRIKAATYVRKLADELLDTHPDANLVIMGDFNDEPDNHSISEILSAKGDLIESGQHNLFNPMYALKQQGQGSYNFRGNWNMLDQILLSQALLKAQQKQPDFNYKKGSATVMKKEWLLQKEGRYEGYPLRTYGGNQYLGGYSDHLPVYIELENVKQMASAR